MRSPSAAPWAPSGGRQKWPSSTGARSGSSQTSSASSASWAFVVLALRLQDQAAITYRGGLFLSAVVSTVVVAALTIPGSVVARLLSLRALTFLGKCTFSTYLWYYPVLTMGNSVSFLASHKWIQWIILFVLSILTYVFIEQAFVSKLLKGSCQPSSASSNFLRLWPRASAISSPSC